MGLLRLIMYATLLGAIIGSTIKVLDQFYL